MYKIYILLHHSDPNKSADIRPTSFRGPTLLLLRIPEGARRRRLRSADAQLRLAGFDTAENEPSKKIYEIWLILLSLRIDAPLRSATESDVEFS